MVFETITQEKLNLDLDLIVQALPEKDDTVLFSENRKNLTINIAPTAKVIEKLEMRNGYAKIHFANEEKYDKAISKIKEADGEEKQRCDMLKEIIKDSTTYGVTKITQVIIN